MIDEATEERASLYALGMLSTEEARQIENEMRSNAEMRALVDDFQHAAAALAHAAPPVAPPPRVRSQLLREIQTERTAAAPVVAAQQVDWMPWAIAASFALLAGLLFYERTELRREVTALNSRDALSALRIATLSSQLAGTRGVGAIAWNAQTQRGMLMLEKMPPLEPNQDYQLWVLDPNQPKPVSGGIVRVDDEGAAKLTFTVEVPIGSADKFAISRERIGGAPSPEGPIVMMSN
jgi:anti-sigma-K factor RskA